MITLADLISFAKKTDMKPALDYLSMIATMTDDMQMSFMRKVTREAATANSISIKRVTAEHCCDLLDDEEFAAAMCFDTITSAFDLNDSDSMCCKKMLDSLFCIEFETKERIFVHREGEGYKAYNFAKLHAATLEGMLYHLICRRPKKLPPEIVRQTALHYEKQLNAGRPIRVKPGDVGIVRYAECQGDVGSVRYVDWPERDIYYLVKAGMYLIIVGENEAHAIQFSPPRM